MQMVNPPWDKKIIGEMIYERNKARKQGLSHTQAKQRAAQIVRERRGL